MEDKTSLKNFYIRDYGSFFQDLIRGLVKGWLSEIGIRTLGLLM